MIPHQLTKASNATPLLLMVALSFLTFLMKQRNQTRKQDEAKERAASAAVMAEVALRIRRMNAVPNNIASERQRRSRYQHDQARQTSGMIISAQLLYLMTGSLRDFTG